MSPPHYVLLSHSAGSAPTLSHPTIQYQFRDDPPLSFPDVHHAHVLLMDYDPAAPHLVRVQSLAPQLAITALRVTDAPAAACVPEDDEPRNTKMYVIEAVAHPPPEKPTAPHDVHPPSLAAFKQRNSLLRKALEYPPPSAASPPPASVPANTHPLSPSPSPSRPPPPLPAHDLPT